MNEHETRKWFITKARQEFIATGETNNINEAVHLYMAAHPETSDFMTATITTREKDRPQTILDEYERPRCRKCGAEMFWKSGCSTCKGPVKKNQWICKACGFKHITRDTLEEAISKLERKEAAENA